MNESLFILKTLLEKSSRHSSHGSVTVFPPHHRGLNSDRLIQSPVRWGVIVLSLSVRLYCSSLSLLLPGHTDT